MTARARIADSIVADLRAQIVSGALPRGTRLPAERELAARYDVSGPTVREALQGLNALGLLDVRHGSGTYVSALAETLVAKSLGALVQLEAVDIQQLIGLLGALSGYAARLAVTRATDEDVARLDAAVSAIAEADDIERVVDALKDFIGSLAAATHDPLLLAIVRFLLDVQLGLARELWPAEYESWHELVTLLQPDRIAIVGALKRRDADELSARVAAFQARAVGLLDERGLFSRLPASDERFVGVLTALAARPARTRERDARRPY